MDVVKNRGIVLHKIPYSDSKNIVKIYTETGTNAYISIRSKKKSQEAMQPMTLINFCSEHKPNTGFAFLRDVEYVNSTMGVNYEVSKATVSMFLNEVLYKLLLNAGEDKHLFTFMYDALNEFCTRDFVPDFHLRFLVHCTMQIGVCPIDNYSRGCVFDALSASFMSEYAASEQTQQVAYWLHALMHQPLFPTCKEQIVPMQVRNALLDTILNYYTCHIADMHALQSPEVVKAILHG